GCTACTPSEYDAHMVAALKDLAEFLDVDHAYFFMTSPDRATYSCTHEVCGPGVAPLRQRYQNAPAGTDAWMEPTLLAGRTARIDSLEAAGEDPGCRSLLHVPTSGITGEFAGAIGVDSHARRGGWSHSDLMLCRIIGNAL